MPRISRRMLLGSAAGVAALAGKLSQEAAQAATESSAVVPAAPFRSMRDYVAALDAHGLVMHIPRIDQDAYEATALMYRARDLHGMRGAPTFLYDQIRIDGEWVDGPLLVNESGHGYSESIVFGLPPVDNGPALIKPLDSYRQARAHVEQLVALNGGEYPLVDPAEVAPAEAPCKQVVLLDDAIDLTRFAFIQGNPADAGRYINTSAVFTRHPKYGVNMGTYRCHLRGPREIAINSEPGQTGYRHLMAARARGEKTARVSIALTPDPYVWMVAGSKMGYSSKGLVDELALAGGLAGQAIETVKSETNDFMVPAHAEMIIEGEVPLDDLRPEGPYGEMVGYQGAVKQEVFWMRVTAVTHRRNPWLMNNFTGTQAGSLMAAGHARTFYRHKKAHPEIVDWFPDTRSVGTTYISIRKTRPGQGMDVAQAIIEQDFFSKILIVVDEDIDVTNREQLLAALGARWQPYGNTKLYESLPALPLDPSLVKRGKGSKIAIDATREWPEEGGREKFPELNRTLFTAGAPAAMATADAQWGEALRSWQPTATIK